MIPYLLGFTNIPNTRAENVTSAIMHAIQRDEPQVDLNKCTAQMYDGAIVMQGNLSGVQKRIKDNHCKFGLNLIVSTINCNLESNL